MILPEPTVLTLFPARHPGKDADRAGPTPIAFHENGDPRR